MSEALARVRNDSILVRPANSPAVSRGTVRSLVDCARVLPARVYVGAAFSALLAGIGVNALLLQRERHPAPLFAQARRHVLPAPKNVPAVRAPVLENPAPAASASAQAPPPKLEGEGEPPTRPLDQIGELLRGEPHGDRMVQAAQGALAKLGYPVKPDGVEGTATEQALREFERAHRLPVTADVTPHLLKQLTAAARAASR